MQQAPYYRGRNEGCCSVSGAASAVRAQRRESTAVALQSIRDSVSARPTRIISRFYRSYPNFGRMQVPIVVGLSRKAIARAARRAAPCDDRASASVAAALLAAERGANIVRVHDVAATRDALSVLDSDAGRSTMSASESTSAPTACAAPSAKRRSRRNSCCVWGRRPAER